MVEEASAEFRFKKIDEKINYRLDEINYNDLMSEKYKKACKYLNYVKQLVVLVSTVAGCVSVSVFPSLIPLPVFITSSAVAVKICAINAGIKNYKSIIKKKKKKHDKIVLVEKDKLNTVEVLISKALTIYYLWLIRFRK